MQPVVLTLAAIAQRHGLNLRAPAGAGGREMRGVCALQSGAPDRIAYCLDARHSDALAATRAGAVVLHPDLVQSCPAPALLAENPQLAYARVAAEFAPPAPPAGASPAAVIDPSATVDPSAAVAAGVVIGAGATVGPGAVLAPGCVIGAGASIGAGCRIGANAVIGDAGAPVRLGARVAVEPGALIGVRGFGLVADGERWQAIPQLGGVVIGDDTEIGAGCTIARGAIGDTVLEHGVKLDAQVHIAHNCHIGAHTVIAGCTGVAGSSVIGKRCIIGGGVRVSDHVRVADGVVLTGATQVPQDIREPGVYSSTLKAMPAADWRRCLAHVRRLDDLVKRLRALERKKK